MEPKVILEYVSLGSAILGPIVAWITKNIVARWRSDALIERIKDKDDIKQWIEDRFMGSKDAEDQIDRLKQDQDRMREDHNSLCAKVERAEGRLTAIEQLRWHARAPNPEPSRRDV